MTATGDDLVWVDDGIVPASQARVSVFDMGFLRGVAAFESLRTYDGHPHALAEHLQRLWTCTGAFCVPPLHDEQTVRDQIAQLQERSGHEELRVNFVVTPGLNTDGLFGAERPTWVIIARRMQPPPSSWYENGIGVVTFPGGRIMPHLKTTNYFSGQEGMRRANAVGAQEAIYHDDQGLISEGVTSNVLLVRDGSIIEPANDALPGITQRLLVPLAARHGLGWARSPIHREELLRAAEVWITSSVRELVPVTRVDGQTIGDGRPGHWARTLGPAFHEACRRDAAADADRAAG